MSHFSKKPIFAQQYIQHSYPKCFLRKGIILRPKKKAKKQKGIKDAIIMDIFHLFRNNAGILVLFLCLYNIPN